MELNTKEMNSPKEGRFKGEHDSLNNVEVVLVDSAEAGLWTVKVTDASHNGGRAQPYAVAVSGVGVNDLRPDPRRLNIILNRYCYSSGW